MPQLADEKHEAFARSYIALKFNVQAASRAVGIKPAVGSGWLFRKDVAARVRELNDKQLKAHDITAARVMMELARVSFADIRGIVGPDGRLKAIEEMDDDTAASVAGIEVETRFERAGTEIDLATGEKVPKFVSVQVTKVKRYDKVPALNILAKHFKLVGDEGDGVNALANALADRLKGARARRLSQPTEGAEDARIIEREHSPADHAEHTGASDPVS